MKMIAFEPTTMALGMALLEKAVRRPARACCCVKLLLRRAPDVLGALNETAEPLLDTLGTTVFHQAVDAFIISFGMALIYLVVFRLMQRAAATEACGSMRKLLKRAEACGSY